MMKRYLVTFSTTVTAPSPEAAAQAATIEMMNPILNVSDLETGKFTEVGSRWLLRNCRDDGRR